MGSVAKRTCARGSACTQYETLREPAKLDRLNHSDICRQCQADLAVAVPASQKMEREVRNAINRAFADRTNLATSKGALADLLKLDRRNGGRGYRSDFGKVLAQMDAKTLCAVRDWLDDNRDEVVKKYDKSTWQRVFTDVGFHAYLEQLPPKARRESIFAGLPDDGLPIQGVAMRVDGKKWNLNIPIRAELLRLIPRYFSQRNYADLLGIGRTAYRTLQDHMKEEDFTLRKFTPNVLERIVRGDKRGPKKKSK